MTLVELMVALAITALVMAAAVGIFTSQHRNFVRDRSEKEIIQDGVDVLKALQTDLLEAGWSVRPNMAFLVKDGGPNGSDRIFINDVDLIDPVRHATRMIEAAECPGCLRIAAISGSTITVNDPWEPSPYADEVLDINGDNQTDFTDNGTDFFVIGDGTDPAKKVASVTAVANTQLTLSLAIDGSFVAPAVGYCVDNGTSTSACHPSGARERFVLRRSDRTTQGRLLPIAENIVDLQVTYQDDDGHWYGEASCAGSGLGSHFCARSPFEPRHIRLLRVSVVLRSPKKDKDRANDPAYCRPAVANRQAGSGPDECGYRYKVHTLVIHPRNT